MIWIPIQLILSISLSGRASVNRWPWVSPWMIEMTCETWEIDKLCFWYQGKAKGSYDVSSFVFCNYSRAIKWKKRIFELGFFFWFPWSPTEMTITLVSVWYLKRLKFNIEITRTINLYLRRPMRVININTWNIFSYPRCMKYLYT